MASIEGFGLCEKEIGRRNSTDFFFATAVAALA